MGKLAWQKLKKFIASFEASEKIKFSLKKKAKLNFVYVLKSPESKIYIWKNYLSLSLEV